VLRIREAIKRKAAVIFSQGDLKKAAAIAQHNSF